MNRLFSLETRLARRCWLVLFFVGLLLELYLVTYWKGKPGLILSPVVWLFGGLLATIAGWKLALFSTENRWQNETQSIENQRIKAWIGWLALACGFFLGAFFLKQVFHEIPEINKLSDILPGKREYIRRLLAGEVVYRPIPFETYALQPTYLPARWLPFLAAQLLKFDYRWIPFLGFVVGLAVWMRGAIRQNAAPGELVLKGILPFVCLGFFAKNDPVSLGVAVELLMVGYYLIFSKFMLHSRPIVVAFCLLLCLLSRYSLVFWLPVLGLIFWMERGWKFLFSVAGWVILGIFVGYLLPFCRHDLGQNFLDASHYYVSACFDTWKTDDWLPAGSVPFQHSRGIGFSVWFYQFAPGDLRQKFDLCLKMSGILSLATVGGLMIYYWFRVRGRGENRTEIFALASLKIFLLVFTGLVICPFSYLFTIPFFMTFPLLFKMDLGQIWNAGNSKKIASAGNNLAVDIIGRG